MAKPAACHCTTEYTTFTLLRPENYRSLTVLVAGIFKSMEIPRLKTELKYRPKKKYKD